MEIPSELIEPHIAKYLSGIIYEIGVGFMLPNEARVNLKYVERFICSCSGIHAQIATSNRFYQFTGLSDDKMIEICKEAIKATPEVH